jgi:hypothetical protein
MRILRLLVIGLCSFLSVAAVAALVYIGTLEMTVLNRAELKSWLVKGGIYKTNFIPNLLQTSTPKATTPGTTTTSGQLAIPEGALKIALERTFTQDYVRQQAESTIDRFYDWIEGKAPNFTFSIPINQKKDTFITELTQAVEPTVAALPICTPALAAASTPCRPADIAPDLYTQALIAASIDKTDFFKQPLTTSNLTTDASSPFPQPLLWLRQLQSHQTLILLALGGIILLAGGVVILLTPTEERFRALSLLGKRVFFGQIFTLVGSLLLLWAFQSGYFRLSSLLSNQPASLANTVSNVTKFALVDIATTLAILSGIVCLIGLVIWISIRLWQRRATHVSVLPPQPPADPDIPA